MPKAKLGLLVDRSGVTSVSILADDPRGREEALGMYMVIKGDIEGFCRKVQKGLAGGVMKGRRPRR
jgi:hypothetical protein